MRAVQRLSGCACTVRRCFLQPSCSPLPRFTCSRLHRRFASWKYYRRQREKTRAINGPNPFSLPPAPPAPPPPACDLFDFDLRSPQLRLLFFGSDDFSLQSLAMICSPPHAAASSLSSLSSSPAPRPQVAVVCAGDAPYNKHPQPVRSFAEQQGLPVFPVAHSLSWRMDGWELPACPFGSSGFDLGVVVSFGHLLPARVISAFPLGCINVHPSLLPRYRGASPIQHALLSGDSETGVSVIDVHPTRLDGGDLLLQLPAPVQPADTFRSLHQRLAALGAQAVLHCINNVQALRAACSPQPVSASPSDFPRAPKLSRAFGLVDFREPATSVYSRWRACCGFMPVYTVWEDKRVIIHWLDGVEQLSGRRGQPGEVRWDASRRLLRLVCGDGSAVLLSMMQIEGKLPMSALAFANGYIVGSRQLDFIQFGDKQQSPQPQQQQQQQAGAGR